LSQPHVRMVVVNPSMLVTMTRLLIGVVLLIVAGCNGNEGRRSVADSQSADGPTSISTAQGQTPANSNLSNTRPDEPTDVPEQAGIGAALRIEEGKVYVGNILPDTPAARSEALKPNDRIVAVADGDEKPVDVTGMEITKVVGMICGPKGTVVRLTIIPAGKGETDLLVVSLTRGNFKELNLFVDGRLLPLGSKAPNFKFIRLVDDSDAELSQLAGHIVVVDFWATWCGPCIKAVDELQSLQSQHSEWEGQVELLLVSVDERKEDAVQLFKEKQWSKAPPVWAGPDVLKAYRVAGLPTVFVLDREGNVAGVDHLLLLDVPAAVKPLLRSTVQRTNDSGGQ
jgi:thiol-disulfide isomerase/thioredoxin